MRGWYGQVRERVEVCESERRVGALGKVGIAGTKGVSTEVTVGQLGRGYKKVKRYIGANEKERVGAR